MTYIRVETPTMLTTKVIREPLGAKESERRVEVRDRLGERVVVSHGHSPGVSRLSEFVREVVRLRQQELISDEKLTELLLLACSELVEREVENRVNDFLNKRIIATIMKSA